MNLSKSRYTQGVTCSKKLWLSCYMPDEASDMGKENVFDTGNKVGELARRLFGKFILIPYNQDYQKMIDDTKKHLLDKPNVICEASFNYDNNFCAVDILKNDPDGVEIYEVKSSTNINNIYIDDIAYQTWILKKLGYNVKKSCIVYINNEYVLGDTFNINEFFKIQDVTDQLDLGKVEKNVKELKEVINNKEEPKIDLSNSCHTPYDCPFFKHCTKKLPTPNVFDLGWNVRFTKKLGMYIRGNVTFQDVMANEFLNEKATNQIKYNINDLEPKINKETIQELLSTLRYPLYFLDFESFQEAIPTIKGTNPYQQICFQYSLHILNDDNTLLHKEYLSNNYDGNPMYGLCEQLVKDIPMDSCVTAYHKPFECGRLKEMARMFPEFREHLINISDNIIDLEIPFANQDYYVRDMEGSSSIKRVLPALYPNDPGLDYHNLDQVHKGDEASAAYLSLKDLSPEEQERLRYNMLRYCELDTYAMVKIYQKLKKI